MKRKVLVSLLLLLLLFLPVFNIAAQGPIGLDAGGVISTGYIKTDDPAYSGLSLLFLLRGGATVTGRYRINDSLSTGVEIGFTYMSISADGTSSQTWIDIPMNAVFRVGGKSTFVEPHVGYYLSATVMDFSGFSVGVKGSLGGFYTVITYVIGSTFKYPRFAIGWQYNNIF